MMQTQQTKYSGFWSTGGGTHGRLDGNSKADIRAKLRLTLRGNLSAGQAGTYRIERNSDDCETVANGVVRVAK